MKVVILEDERLASEKLSSLIREVEPSAEIVTTLQSVEDSIDWFENNDVPDLIFSDIQLLDGLSFEIFASRNIKCPVIFTTAYDQYAIQAFEVNSIDYLLKPVRKEKLEAGMKKLRDVPKTPASSQLEKVTELLMQTNRTYKQRFLVKVGQRIQTIPVEDIAYFFTQEKMTYLVTEEGKKLPLDQTLEEIDQILDPDNFFRINRKYIVKITAVKEIHPYFKGRLKIMIAPDNKDDIVISSEKTPHFKKWLDR